MSPSRQRGAALVEYSLVLAVLVIGLLGVLQGVEDDSQQEVANEFNCVSERPPPTNCLKRAVTTTTTTTVSATTSTSAPVETTTSTTSSTTTTSTTVAPPAPGPTQAGWYYTTRRVFDGHDSVSTYFILQDGNGQPLGNRTVRFEVRDQEDTVVATGTCTTNGNGYFAGWCGVAVAIPSANADVRLVVAGVGGTPAMAPPSGSSPWV